MTALGRRATTARSTRTPGALVALALTMSGCAFLPGQEGTVDVLDIEPGQCFEAPEDVEAQISSLREMPCEGPHDREAYAVVAYQPPDEETDADVFPGDEALQRFADGRCAQTFGEYTGVDYLDAEDLFFTYLLPSPRSWQDGDRSVICFAFRPGRPLEGSVRQGDP